MGSFGAAEFPATRTRGNRYRSIAFPCRVNGVFPTAVPILFPNWGTCWWYSPAHGMEEITARHAIPLENPCPRPCARWPRGDPTRRERIHRYDIFPARGKTSMQRREGDGDARDASPNRRKAIAPPSGFAISRDIRIPAAQTGFRFLQPSAQPGGADCITRGRWAPGAGDRPLPNQSIGCGGERTQISRRPRETRILLYYITGSLPA